MKKLTSLCYTEYPTAGAQASGFTSLLSELRTALDAHAKKKNDTVPYQITVSIPRLDMAGLDLTTIY